MASFSKHPAALCDHDSAAPALTRDQVVRLLQGFDAEAAHFGEKLEIHITGGYAVGNRPIHDIDFWAHDRAINFIWGHEDSLIRKLNLPPAPCDGLVTGTWFNPYSLTNIISKRCSNHHVIGNLIYHQDDNFSMLMEGAGLNVFVLKPAPQLAMKLAHADPNPKDIGDMQHLCKQLGINNAAGLENLWIQQGHIFPHAEVKIAALWDKISPPRQPEKSHRITPVRPVRSAAPMLAGALAAPDAS